MYSFALFVVFSFKLPDVDFQVPGVTHGTWVYSVLCASGLGFQFSH